MMAPVKKKGHYCETQIETAKHETYTLSVSKMSSGTGEAYAKQITTAITDVEKAGNLQNCRDGNILCSVTNTMTDRVSVNRKTNAILCENCEPLDEFFCGMHPLDTIAKSAEKKVNEWEIQAGQQQETNKQYAYRSRSESGTQVLLKAVGKLFYKEGVGLPQIIFDYLIEEGYGDCIPARFVDNRFNILFYNAGVLYLLKDTLLKIFTKKHGVTNRLQHAVVNDLQNDRYLSASRALGLMGENDYITMDEICGA